jgi:hypothetical protein
MDSQPNTYPKRDRNPYANCPWLHKRLQGEEAAIWRKARLICLLEKNYSKKLSWLNLSQFIRSNQDPTYNFQDRNSTTIQKTTAIDTIGPVTWGDDSQQSLKKLIVCIVTQWPTDLQNDVEPDMDSNLCSELIPSYLQQIEQHYSKWLFYSLSDNNLLCRFSSNGQNKLQLQNYGEISKVFRLIALPRAVGFNETRLQQR